MKKYALSLILVSALFSAFPVNAMFHRNPQMGMIVESIEEVYSQNLPSNKIIINDDTHNTTQKNIESDNSTLFHALFCTTINPYIRDAATQHNETIPLIKPQELSEAFLNHFVDTDKPIGENIKNILALSAVCTHFNNKLEYFGSLLRKYDIQAKNEALHKLIQAPGPKHLKHWDRRRALLLFVYAGADYNSSESIISRAIMFNDLDMLKTLFRYGANSNSLRPYLDNPNFFYAQTPEIVQLCVDNNAKLDASTHLYPNVLWYLFSVMPDNINDIVPIYIDNGADVRKKNDREQCLLHQIVSHPFVCDKYIKAIDLLISSAPEMINTIDTNKETPLDILIQQRVERQNLLMPLFKQYGAKTYQELEQEKLQNINQDS